MIDHGFAFNGPHWEFQDTPLNGLYFRTSVYEEVTSLDSFQPWLDMVANFPVEVIDGAWKEIPREWLDQDEDALEKLLERLAEAARESDQLIEDVRANALARSQIGADLGGDPIRRQRGQQDAIAVVTIGQIDVAGLPAAELKLFTRRPKAYPAFRGQGFEQVGHNETGG